MGEFYKDPNQFVSHRRPFIVTVAMSKEKLESKMKEDVKKEPKDKRNLYLAREGCKLLFYIFLGTFIHFSLLFR